MQLQRRSGILLHPTSLPGRYGIGDLGPRAYEFIDFLVASRQGLWQILPLGPTGFGDSPYQSFSAFAGNPLLVSPEALIQQGLLASAEISTPPEFRAGSVDYGPVIDFKERLLRAAYREFATAATAEQQSRFSDFCKEQSGWLEDYALFMALKHVHQREEGGVWNTWPEQLRTRRANTLLQWRNRLSDELSYHKFQQYLFFDQWLALKEYANGHGIEIIGDAPIFVAFDSADVWSRPDLYYLEQDGSPSVVAGVPPDYFSKTGQRWGNPLYRWDVMARDRYRWWAERLRTTLTQVDIVRIDHFRGFEAYWEIPADEPTAVVGRWVKGPAERFFLAMQEALGQLPIIAEDLGVITPEVEALRNRFEFPGMKILQFAFSGERNSSFLPHNYEQNCVVYTGTHDNETTAGWYKNADPYDQDHVRRYTARDGREIAWDLIRLAWSSVADTAIAPFQDLLSLGNEARMNFPSKVGGWWRWRLPDNAFSSDLAERLAEMTRLYGRAAAEK